MTYDNCMINPNRTHQICRFLLTKIASTSHQSYLCFMWYILNSTKLVTITLILPQNINVWTATSIKLGDIDLEYFRFTNIYDIISCRRCWTEYPLVLEVWIDLKLNYFK